MNLVCVSGPEYDPFLEIYGPNGFYAEDDDGGSNGVECTLSGSHYSSQVSFVAPTTGIYVIVATS